MLVKDTWVSIPLVRTLPYSHYFLFVAGKLKSQFPHISKEILEDLEQFRNYVIDQEMFNVIWALLERKYEEEYDYPSEVAKSLTLDFLIRYFKKNNFLFALFRVNQHFKKSYTEYKRLNIVQSSKKLCDFLKEYDLDYRKEKEPTVAEKLLKEVDTYLNKHQHVFATKDLTKSKTK